MIGHARAQVEVRDLYCLTALFDEGSYGRAAKRLGIDVSTLSRRISSLEDELGVLLFERTRAGVRLTPAGQDSLRIARRVLDDVESLRENANRASSGQAGRIKLATQTSTLGPTLRTALRAFRQSRPDISIHLSEVTDSDALIGLRERRHDAAVLFTPSATEAVAYHPLWQEPLVLAVSAGHPLASRTAIRWEDLSSEAMIVRGWSGSETFHDLEAELIGSQVRFRTHHAGCVDLLNLVAIDEGLMIALASHREIKIPDVVYLDIDEPNAFVDLSLVWATDLEDPIVGSFTSFMRDFVHREKSDPSGEKPRRCTG